MENMNIISTGIDASSKFMNELCALPIYKPYCFLNDKEIDSCMVKHVCVKIPNKSVEYIDYSYFCDSIRIKGFILENYEIVIASSLVTIGALYFFRDQFVSEEQNNDGS